MTSPRRADHGHRRNRFHDALTLWGWPLALGLLSASGLVSALVSDDWGDTWSWIALGVPVLVMGRHALRR
ncbi:MAG: hypothetical protein QM788_18355 [Roseateles sp.]|uniref:hypothetical protein n=1 Tax=Roseateles sp. TaxID=1971397 RepID=UPI0039E80003